MSPRPQESLSNYRVGRLLGAGGMGSVYLAYDLTLHREVAIKFISHDRSADPRSFDRLLREARAAAALDHPHVCTVYQVIVDSDGRAAIVMQYVKGETLRQKLRHGPLDVRLSLQIVADTASALSAAHKLGIIHRDLKPQNIIVTPRGRAKLLDFGIATVSSSPISFSSESTTATATETSGGLIGTPPYMSPEQARQARVDARSDLFSLGAVLFECLTGERAFKGQSRLDTLAQVLETNPPPISNVRPELTKRFDSLCRRLLEKDPEGRFRSADEFLLALHAILQDHTTSEPEPHPVRQLIRQHPKMRRLAGGLLTAIVIALALGLIASSR